MKALPKTPVPVADNATAQIAFQLLAPNNAAVMLMGSFNAWQELPMAKGDDGYFRVTVPLVDGAHQYKFRLQSQSWFFAPGEWVEITDPYATEIDPPSQNGVMRILGGKRIVDTYVWEHDGQFLPADSELIIYELHVGNFSGGEADHQGQGKYVNVQEKLDYLVELGINAVEIMPINSFPGDVGWGYNSRYFFAPESSYGTSEELKALIDACHSRGMRVICDIVCNHSESESPLTRIDFDYWYHHDPKDAENNWGPEFNYEFVDERTKSSPAWQFMGDVIRHWVSEYHIDGLRFDSCRQVANYDFMHWITSEAKAVAGIKPFFTVAEFLPPDPSVTGVDGPMDACWQEGFRYAVGACLTSDAADLGALQDAIDPRRIGYQAATNIVNYLTNHDHDHLMATLAANQLFDEEAFRRARLGAVVLMTSLGLPMLWMGEEFGVATPRILDRCQIDWTLLANEHNSQLLHLYKALIALRRDNAALRLGDVAFFHKDDENRVLAYVRWHDDGTRVAVIVNVTGQTLYGYAVTAFPDGVWRDWAGDATWQAEAGHLVLDLAGHEARVLVGAP